MLLPKSRAPSQSHAQSIPLLPRSPLLDATSIVNQSVSFNMPTLPTIALVNNFLINNARGGDVNLKIILANEVSKGWPESFSHLAKVEKEQEQEHNTSDIEGSRSKEHTKGVTYLCPPYLYSSFSTSVRPERKRRLAKPVYVRRHSGRHLHRQVHSLVPSKSWIILLSRHSP